MVLFYIPSDQIISLPKLWAGRLLCTERLFNVIPYSCFYKGHNHLSWATGASHLSRLSSLYSPTIYTSGFFSPYIELLEQEPILYQAFSWIPAHGACRTKDLRIISPCSHFPFRRNISSSHFPMEWQLLDFLWGRRWRRAAEFLRSFRNSRGENRKRRWKWHYKYVGCFIPGWMKTYNPLGYLSQHHFLWI